MAKYSDKYDVICENVISDMIANTLSLNKQKLYKGEYSYVQMPNKNIGICARISIPAGSDSILKQHEPILIEVCGNDLEHSELKVYPNRENFPYESFPHINFPVNGMPPTLCLTRENFIDWYAEHTFSDFLKLIHQWYQDALNGNLIKFNGEDFYEPFRPTRTDVILFKVPYEDAFAENFMQPRTICFAVRTMMDDIYRADILDKNYKQENCQIGILLTKPMQNLCKSWFIKYPQTIDELLRFIYDNGFIFDANEFKEALEQNENKCTNIIFQIAFPRPLKILGKNSRLDYLTFLVSKEDLRGMNNNGKVQNVTVYDLTTIDQARYLSNTKKSIEEKNILLLGCGAIGSKMAAHLYRSGLHKITLCDNDSFQPHNVIRHALFTSNIFQPKVSLMKKALDGMFADFRKVQVYDVDIIEWLPQQDLSQYDLIIDATASASVFRLFDELSLDIDIPCIRFSLSDAGNLGLVYLRSNKATLISDYYMYLASQAIEDDDLSNWLCKEANYNYDLVRIGEGCHSNTMRLSDDIISTHTAIASNIVRNMFEHKLENYAYLSFVNIEYVGQVFTEKYKVPKFINIPCSNNAKWNIRMPQEIFESILLAAKKSKNIETGGYMMGNIDIKYNTIYVLHHFIPEDSCKQSTKLSLGKKGWRKEYDKVIKRTGKVISYIGDWHSHPKGSLQMSTTDIFTNYIVKQEEIDCDYSLCLITNGKEMKAHLLTPNIRVIRAE